MKQEPAVLNVNLDEYPDYACPKCGCTVWETITVLKKIPGLIVGRPGDIMIDITYFRCEKCKERINLIQGRATNVQGRPDIRGQARRNQG